MKYKTWVSIMIIILLMTSCKQEFTLQTPSQAMYDISHFTDADFSLKDTERSTFFQMKDTKSTIENKIGRKLQTVGNDSSIIADYEGVSLFFRNNLLMGYIIEASKNDTNRFRTNRDIGLGFKLEDIIKAYGEATSQKDRYYNYVFFKQENEIILIKPEDIMDDVNLEKYLYIHFSLTQSNTINLIIVGDYNFVINMK